MTSFHFKMFVRNSYPSKAQSGKLIQKEYSLLKHNLLVKHVNINHSCTFLIQFFRLKKKALHTRNEPNKTSTTLT